MKGGRGRGAGSAGPQRTTERAQSFSVVDAALHHRALPTTTSIF